MVLGAKTWKKKLELRQNTLTKVSTTLFQTRSYFFQMQNSNDHYDPKLDAFKHNRSTFWKHVIGKLLRISCSIIGNGNGNTSWTILVMVMVIIQVGRYSSHKYFSKGFSNPSQISFTLAQCARLYPAGTSNDEGDSVNRTIPQLSCISSFTVVSIISLLLFSLSVL